MLYTLYVLSSHLSQRDTLLEDFVRWFFSSLPLDSNPLFFSQFGRILETKNKQKSKQASSYGSQTALYFSTLMALMIHSRLALTLIVHWNVPFNMWKAVSPMQFMTLINNSLNIGINNNLLCVCILTEETDAYLLLFFSSQSSIIFHLEFQI